MLFNTELLDLYKFKYCNCVKSYGRRLKGSGFESFELINFFRHFWDRKMLLESYHLQKVSQYLVSGQVKKLYFSKIIIKLLEVGIFINFFYSHRSWFKLQE